MASESPYTAHAVTINRLVNLHQSIVGRLPPANGSSADDQRVQIRDVFLAPDNPQNRALQTEIAAFMRDAGGILLRVQENLQRYDSEIVRERYEADAAHDGDIRRQWWSWLHATARWAIGAVLIFVMYSAAVNVANRPSSWFHVPVRDLVEIHHGIEETGPK